MESYPSDNFGEGMEIPLIDEFKLKPKRSSAEVLQRWRALCGVVRNPKRRFRFIANIRKREEAAAMLRLNEEGTSDTSEEDKDDGSEEDSDDNGKEDDNDDDCEEDDSDDNGEEETWEANKDDDRDEEGKEDNGEEEVPKEKEAHNSRVSSSLSPLSEIEEPLEELKEDDRELKDGDDEEAPNNKVYSSLSSPFELERNIDNSDSVLSVQAQEPDHAGLLNFIEESTCQFSSNGERGGDVLAGENGGCRGVSQDKHGNNQDVHRRVLVETNTNAYLVGCFGTETTTRVRLSRIPGSKAFIKWMFIVLNVVAETCQAMLTQKTAQGKMRRQIYLKWSIITSSVCLLMSLVEAVHKGRSSGAVWRRRGYCCWFYSQGRLFGTFLLYFGIICSMVQLMVNLIEKLINKDFIKFDYVPLLLALCHLVATIIASQKKTNSSAASRQKTNSSPTILNCRIHGCNPGVPTIVDGRDSPVYGCSRCQMDSPV